MEQIHKARNGVSEYVYSKESWRITIQICGNQFYLFDCTEYSNRRFLRLDCWSKTRETNRIFFMVDP